MDTIISNSGSPLRAQDGTILSGKEIEFLLVDANGNACDAWDAITGERVLPIKKTVITSTGVGVGALPAGEFTVSLWPNDRGSEVTFYRCSIKGHPEAEFTAALTSSETAIPWIDFMAQGQPLQTTPLLQATVPYGAGGWTPIDVSGADLILSGATGRYVRVGNLVYIAAEWTFPETDDTQNIAIGGLPISSNVVAVQHLSNFGWVLENNILTYPQSTNQDFSGLFCTSAGIYLIN